MGFAIHRTSLENDLETAETLYTAIPQPVPAINTLGSLHYCRCSSNVRNIHFVMRGRPGHSADLGRPERCLLIQMTAQSSHLKWHAIVPTYFS